MTIPTLTHLQFLVLAQLGGLEQSGRELRHRLAKQGAKRSLPGFYQLMARMEDAGLVAGAYKKVKIDEERVQERWYKITGLGVRQYNSARDFYYSADALPVMKGGRQGA